MLTFYGWPLVHILLFLTHFQQLRYQCELYLAHFHPESALSQSDIFRIQFGEQLRFREGMSIFRIFERIKQASCMELAIVLEICTVPIHDIWPVQMNSNDRAPSLGL